LHQKEINYELDGSQHLDQVEYDKERTKYFETLGYKVIRFWNNAIMKDINGVIKAIQFALESENPKR
jgi:very-short-patch-repair endonuclease